MTSLNLLEIASMRSELQTVQLSMKCNIERFEMSGHDPDGHEIGSWVVLHNDLPCWYWEQVLRTLLEERVGPLVNVLQSYPEMLMPASTDVTTRDRITSVSRLEETGWVVVATNLDIKTALHRLLDVYLTVEAIG